MRHALISNALGLYCNAFDMEQFDLLDTLLSPDVEIHWPNAVVQGLAAVRADIEQRRGRYRPGQMPWHLVQNIALYAATETSTSVATRYSFGLMERETQGLVHFGWYDDDYVLDNGMWRLRRRRMLTVFDR